MITDGTYSVIAIGAHEPHSVIERVARVRDHTDRRFEVARWERDYRDRYGRVPTYMSVQLIKVVCADGTEYVPDAPKEIIQRCEDA